MLSDRLKQLREESGYNQEYVAEYLGVKQQTYSRYENSLSEPDIDSIIKVGKLYNVSIDYLLGLTDYRQGELNKLPDELKDEIKNYIDYLMKKRKEENTKD